MGWMTGVKLLPGLMMGIFLFTTASTLALMPTQPPTEWIPRALTPRKKWPGMKVTTHLYLAPRLRMQGTMLPLPQYTFMVWCLI